MNDPMKYWREQEDLAKVWPSEVDAIPIDESGCTPQNLIDSLNPELSYDYDINILPQYSLMKEFYEDTFRQIELCSSMDKWFYKPTLIDANANSIILQKNQVYQKNPWVFKRVLPTIYKFSKHPEKDNYFLKKIYERNNKFLQRIPVVREDFHVKYQGKLLGLAMEGDFAMLPLYVFNIEDDIGIKITLETVKALTEMRKANVWHHRDINPRNILTFGHGMVRSQWVRIELIDFEYATENRNSPTRDGNRRFWGLNDLNSLGATIYYQVKGNSPFSDVEPKKRDMSDISSKIYENSKKAYECPNGPQMREALKKVNQIGSEGLVDVVTHLLLAKDDDHEKIQTLCEKYLDVDS